jgi:signal transduction histidine kinase
MRVGRFFLQGQRRVGWSSPSAWVRPAWLFVTLFGVFAFALDLPRLWRTLTSVCAAAPCMVGQPTSEGLAALHRLGLSPQVYSVFMLTANVMVPAVIIGVMGFVVWQQPQDKVVASLAFAGVTCSLIGTMTEMAEGYPWLVPPLHGFWFIAGTGFALGLLSFPDGRFVPPWSRYLAYGLVAASALVFVPGMSELGGAGETLAMGGFMLTFPLALGCLLYRYARSGDAKGKRQIKWVVLSIGVMVGVLIVNLALDWLVPKAWMTAGAPGDMVTTLLGSSSIIGFWLCIAISVYRYRLFDIDLIIRRTLVYVTLTVAVTLLYVLLVTGTDYLLKAPAGGASWVLAALPVAFVTGPLHGILQRRVGRFFPVSEGAGLEPPLTPHVQPTFWHRVRPLWWAYGLFVIGLVLAGVPAALETRMTPCTGEGCEMQWWRLTPERAAALDASGISPTFYAYWTQFTSLLVPLWGFTIFGLTVWRKPGNWVAHLLALAFLSCNANYPGSLGALAQTQSWVGWVNAGLVFISASLMTPIFLAFPDGHFVPRWSRYLVPLAVLAAVLFALLVSPAPPTYLYSFFPVLGGWGILATLLTAGCLIYRYRVVATPQVRRQIWWVLLGILVSDPLRFLLEGLIVRFGENPQFYLLLETAYTLNILFVMTTIAIAMLFYNLFDVGMVVRRALVYGGLTLSVVLIYLAFVAAAGVLALGSNNLLVSLLATGAVALAFGPLRERLQRGVNRLLYGYRDEPYKVMTELGRNLEASFEPTAVLPATVMTVAETLKLPFVEIALKQATGLRSAASVGEASDKVETFPLVYAGETLGELRVSPRASEDKLSRADTCLLTDLSRQVGVAAHALLLQADLERSRLRVVTAREEARRGLGNDLHDTVGHQFAALTRCAETASNMLEQRPGEARQLLQEMVAQGRAAADHVRALAHQLHPPELEVLGLTGVIREWAEAEGGLLQLQLELPESLPRLPAAVEVAAYCTVREALQNVHKHARARRCTVRLALVRDAPLETSVLTVLEAPVLEIDVTDDGCGLRRPDAAGLGLTSMRERAAEVGGTCWVESSPGCGTRVALRLPCPELH